MTLFKKILTFSEKMLFKLSLIHNVFWGLVFLYIYSRGRDPLLERHYELICEQNPFSCWVPIEVETFSIWFFTALSLWAAARKSVWKWVFILLPIVYLRVLFFYNESFPPNL